jgi:hypothetical protein
MMRRVARLPDERRLRALTIGISRRLPIPVIQACQSAEDYVPGSAGMKRKVQTLSRGLAEFTQTQVAQFIHQSVEDFFLGKGLSALDGGLMGSAA